MKIEYNIVICCNRFSGFNLNLCYFISDYALTQRHKDHKGNKHNKFVVCVNILIFIFLCLKFILLIIVFVQVFSPHLPDRRLIRVQKKNPGLFRTPGVG